MLKHLYDICVADWQQFSYDTSWWRHQMETFSALLALWAGNSPVTGEFPSQRASDANSCCFLWYANWVNDRGTGDLWRHSAHYCVTIMYRIKNNVKILNFAAPNRNFTRSYYKTSYSGVNKGPVWYKTRLDFWRCLYCFLQVPFQFMERRLRVFLMYNKRALHASLAIYGKQHMDHILVRNVWKNLHIQMV